ncbi:hypothetical protein [Bacillus cereus group sp. BfR-BA-02730]|uniref:hypothetical protein n=1 Tax=Bacillus cereus group sp. BfR-BA-02730 TaxID=3094893 RepID=UPI0029C32B78|nr:hypothetical protein [Bacillus cereus group sp. BfR-BA-02730]MDX5808412.1 hypothetical protein [Bacillus cereus group sp. BfR-BA-02730]
MAMLKQGEKKVITDFKYVLFGYQGRVDCDVIEVYSGVGTRFLKKIDGSLQEVLFIAGNADKVELVPKYGAKEKMYEHYYIRVDSVNIYAKLIDDRAEKNTLEIGDRVFVVDRHDVPFKLMLGFAENIPGLEEELPNIQKDFEYEVIEVVNENIVLIQKDKNKNYMTRDKVTTLEEIKTNAKLWNERQRNRGVK